MSSSVRGQDTWVSFLAVPRNHCETRGKMFTFVYLHFSVCAECAAGLPTGEGCYEA